MKILSNKLLVTMPQIPFNEHLLWRGELQKSKPIKIRDQTKYFVHSEKIIYEMVDATRYQNDLNYRYKIYSGSYWAGVNKRIAEYRQRNAEPIYSEDIQEPEIIEPEPEPKVKPRFKWSWYH